MTSMKRTAAMMLLLASCACTVGPKYRRPPVTVPNQYRGVPDLSKQPNGEPFAEMQWSVVFQDEALRSLIKEALTNNYDVRIAASRILQAGAVLGITRADQFPSVGTTGSLGNTRTQPFQGNSSLGSAYLQASWNRGRAGESAGQ
jgi:outer membrane protein, multidrug efflux system